MINLKSIPYLISHISILLLLSSCSKEKSIAESYYNNPTKDSIKFGYNISTLYFMNFDSSDTSETSFDFKLDTFKNIYSWSEVTIRYQKSNSEKVYTPIYINGYLTSLTDHSILLENIDIEYKLIPPSNVRLVSALKYFRVTNPFALIFSYDSVNLKRVERRYLDRETGDIGGLIESATFCANEDMGSCIDNSATADFQYSEFFNNLYHSNELLPFILLLKNPQNSSIDNILPDLPLYFSKHYPSTISRSNPGTFELGLNNKFYPTFFYFHKANSGLVQGYNFSLR